MRNTRMTKLVAGSLLATVIGMSGAGVASARVVDLTEAGTATTSSSADADTAGSSAEENLPEEASTQAKKMLEDIANNPDLNLPPEVTDVLTAIANSDGSLGDLGSASGLVDESQASDVYKELQPQLKEALEDPSAWNDLLAQLKTGVESIDTAALNDAINSLIRSVNSASGAGTSTTDSTQTDSN